MNKISNYQKDLKSPIIPGYWVRMGYTNPPRSTHKNGKVGEGYPWLRGLDAEVQFEGEKKN